KANVSGDGGKYAGEFFWSCNIQAQRETHAMTAQIDFDVRKEKAHIVVSRTAVEPGYLLAVDKKLLLGSRPCRVSNGERTGCICEEHACINSQRIAFFVEQLRNVDSLLKNRIDFCGIKKEDFTRAILHNLINSLF